MAYGQTVKTPSAPLKQKHSYRGQKELECKGTMAGVHNGLPCSDTVLSDGISEALTMQPPWTPPELCWLCLHSFAQGLGWPLGCLGIGIFKRSPGNSERQPDLGQQG